MTEKSTPTKMPLNAHELDVVFKNARKADPIPDQDLVARIMADAAGVQHSFGKAPMKQTPNVRSLWAHFVAAMGGWRGVSAMTACVCFGVLVGFNAPDSVAEYVPLFSANAQTTGDFDLVDMFGLNDILVEG